MIEELSIATIRSLIIDMINKANSGHPGMAIGSTPALYTLWTRHLNIYPKISSWENRDRFVLASGHACALLYSLLHLSGFDVSMDDLKSFRQWNSKTPGHPEVLITDGVDVSSGPLGQGIAMAVGMAIAEKYLAARFNKDNMEIVDHFTYALCGDGDLQEGVTNEASSLAGHLGLGKLIVIYDSNKIQLDGPVSMAFSENTKKKFEAINWQVLEVSNGEDVKSIDNAIMKAKEEQNKPTIIINHTIIGKGAKMEGTKNAHGTPLGQEEGKNTKLSYGFDHEDFFVPNNVYNDFNKKVIKRGEEQFKKWQSTIEKYSKKYPKEFLLYNRAMRGEFSFDITYLLDKLSLIESEATRNSSGKCIQEIAKQNELFLAGCADVVSSNKSYIESSTRFSKENPIGRNIYFGIREFAMVSIMNGILLHKGLRIVTGAFLAFSDYLKPALRMSCLMELPAIITLSHDSIAVGEDGPTHQPIEQLAMLRSMPNLQVIRPADARETACAWKIAIETKNRPTAIILTRQNTLNVTNSNYKDVQRGAYIVSKEQDDLEGIIIASGSEVSLALEGQKELFKLGHKGVRVVSMPCVELFDNQSDKYKEYILPNKIKRRLALEMSSDSIWYKFVGSYGNIMQIHTYGVSAKAEDIIRKFGFTVEQVVKNYMDLL